MISKKASLGDFMVDFFVTIFVIVILVIFAFLANIITDVFSKSNEEIINNENSLGVDNGRGYMDNYFRLVNARGVSFNESKNFDVALLEAGYEK